MWRIRASLYKLSIPTVSGVGYYWNAQFVQDDIEMQTTDALTTTYSSIVSQADWCKIVHFMHMKKFEDILQI